MRTLRKFLGTTALAYCVSSKGNFVSVFKKYGKVMLVLAIVAGLIGISGCVGQQPTGQATGDAWKAKT